MSKQITVRLPEEQVAYLDEQVRAGHAESRAAVVAVALRRLQRERTAERETGEIAALRGEAYPDLAAIPGAIDHDEIDYGT